MAVELEKLAGQYPHMADVYKDLADRVMSLRGAEAFVRTRLSQFPSVHEIGEAIINEGYRAAGLFVLNAAKRLPTNEENRPKAIQRVPVGGPARYYVAFEGREIVLSGGQLELLDFFSTHPNQVFASERLGEIFGGYNPQWVRNNIFRLRKRIEENPANPTRLVNVGHKNGNRGQGYMFKRAEQNGRR